ncbi:helix-turn-helix domain-containing protein [Candidatus Woesearchaeota archaeon]|nr:helix-turn-helix domain-containing protein [Candidatus Woesearchaeota archaeon]
MPKGPVIGPLVMCGVLVDEKDEPKLRKLGVKDSKLLTPKQREFLYPKILKIILGYKIIKLSPEEIDKAVESEETNLNWLEAEKTAEIINELKPDKAFVDCPSTNIPAYTNYIKNLLKVETKLECLHHGESKSICIAAASVLAKVIRDREIEDIKKEVGKDFGSLHFNEKVLIEHNNKISIKKIGPLIENGPWNIKVFSLNKKDLNIKKYPVTSFIEHPKTEIFEVELERGKSIKLSSNHPLFCLNENLDIIPKKLNCININDHIAVAGGFNSKLNLINIDLVEILKESSKKSSPVYVKINKEFFKNNEKKIRKLLEDQKYSRTAYFSWLKKEFIPLNIFAELNSKLNVKIFTREGKIRLDRYFKINKDFMWFLGIFIAEGWLTDYSTLVSNQDMWVINKIKNFANKHKINYFYNPIKKEIGLSSILLVKILKNLIKGNTAYTKEIPEFVLSTNKIMIRELLHGIYYGDGYITGGNWEIELRSEKIIEQIQWLNLMLGIFSTNRRRYTKPAFITHSMSKSTNSLSPDNLPPVVGEYIKKIRRENNMTKQQLSKKADINVKTLINIEKKRNSCIQKSILKKILKVIPNKKLKRLLNSDLCWLRLKKINFIEKDKVYDFGVNYKDVENFLGGKTGIILHNSGYPSDPNTKKFLKDNYDKYPKIIRKSWSTYKDLVEKNKQKSLSDF